MDYLSKQSKLHVEDGSIIHAVPTHADVKNFPFFYAQMDYNDDVMEQIQEICNCQPTPQPLDPEDILPNKLCIAKDVDDLYYRALVTKLDPASSTASVFYFDFGNTREVAFGKIARFCENLFCYPAQAFAMELTNRVADAEIMCKALKVMIVNDNAVEFQIMSTRVDGKRFMYKTFIPTLEEMCIGLNPAPAPVCLPSTAVVVADVAPIIEQADQQVTLNESAPLAVAMTMTPAVTMSNGNPSMVVTSTGSTDTVDTARNVNASTAAASLGSLAQAQQPAVAVAEPSLPIPVVEVSVTVIESNIAEPPAIVSPAVTAVVPEAPTPAETADDDLTATAAVGGGSQQPIHISFVPHARPQPEALPVVSASSEVPETSSVVVVAEILESTTATTEDQSTTLTSLSLSSTVLGLGVGTTTAAAAAPEHEPPITDSYRPSGGRGRGIFGRRGRGMLTDLDVQEIKDELLNDPLAFERVIRGFVALRNMMDALDYHH